MYIPIFKGRRYENIVLREYRDLFLSNQIIPLVELISLKDKTVDEVINEYDESIRSKYFLDFFAFEAEKYMPYNTDLVEFAATLNSENQYNYLNDLLIKTKNSDYAIPVISIKEARKFIFDENKIKELIANLQKEKIEIAVRIEAHLFDDYFDVINKTLRDTDYFLFDIGGESVDSFIFQIEDFNSLKSNKYHSAILNSPRKRNIYNNEYEKNAYTDLIDNKIATEYRKNGFDSFGDYLGLKDELPRVRSALNSDGHAHTLFYSLDNNSFYSALNDYDSGLKGFKEVYDHLMFKEEELNKDKDCLAYEYLKRYEGHTSYGGWGNWRAILMIRTLSELKKIYQ